MFQRLLLALDTADSGEVASSFTLALARMCGAEVHVVHIQLSAESSAETDEVVADALREMHGAGVRAFGVTYRTTAHDVPAAICDLAQECRADAIVVGSRRRRLGMLWRHGTREQIARRTSLPVITAPAPLRISRALEAAPSELVGR